MPGRDRQARDADRFLFSRLHKMLRRPVASGSSYKNWGAICCRGLAGPVVTHEASQSATGNHSTSRKPISALNEVIIFHCLEIDY